MWTGSFRCVVLYMKKFYSTFQYISEHICFTVHAFVSYIQLVCVFIEIVSTVCKSDWNWYGILCSRQGEIFRDPIRIGVTNTSIFIKWHVCNVPKDDVCALVIFMGACPREVYILVILCSTCGRVFVATTIFYTLRAIYAPCSVPLVHRPVTPISTFICNRTESNAHGLSTCAPFIRIY